MKYTLILCVLCLVACGNRCTPHQSPAPQSPVRYGYKILNSYPHDTGAYTQGLLWHEGKFIESTGEYGSSTLRRVELTTGEATQKISLPNDIFGEGAALFGGSIYQLTWHAGKCFVYDPATFEKTGEFTYNGQGWGLTTDGTRLYMSDGTPNIAVRNPATFAVERSIVVRNEGELVEDINELEWIEGRIWANIYLKDEIVIIDPADGRVEGVIDFTGISSGMTLVPYDEVMNGIAYDPATKRIFVTGKNWSRLFEIEPVKK